MLVVIATVDGANRARLSPSPATGLIGLRENVYIAEYFRTIGFVPFTNER